MDDLTKKLVGSVQLTENDVISHAADIFKNVAQEVSMEEGATCCVLPTNFTQKGPYEFHFTPRGHRYIQLSKTRLYMKLKIVHGDGTDIANTEHVSVCNLIGSSMIERVEIDINGKPESDLTNTHFHYKTYLETLLSYGYTARTSHLQASRFIQDTGLHFDDVAYHATADQSTKNKGLAVRRTMTEKSKFFDVMFPIHSDFMQCDRLLPSMNFTIKLFRQQNDNFFLMSPTDDKTYKIHIEEMKMYVRYINVSPAIFRSHELQMANKRMILPINKTEVKTHTFPTGFNMLNLPNFFNGILPKHIIIGILHNDNYNGTIKTNPYNFQNHDVNYMCLKVNNVLVPAEPYTPDYENKLFIREFRSLFDNLGIHHDDCGNSIGTAEYFNGTNFYAFDLSPDLCNGFHSHPFQPGTIDIDCRLKNPLTKPVTLMAFAIYNAIVSIDKNGKAEVGMI